MRSRSIVMHPRAPDDGSAAPWLLEMRVAELQLTYD